MLLAPNRWSFGSQSLDRPLSLDGRAVRVRVSQPGASPDDCSSWGAPVGIAVDGALARDERAAVKQLIARMLRVHDDVQGLHDVDTRLRATGRGRISRSPTFFEDVIKTITSCNVQWGGTVAMNAGLCALSAGGAFPAAAKLARTRPATLRAKCRVGYRDVSIIRTAKLFASGNADPAWFEDPAREDDELFAALKRLPGVGPYAAGNLMQLLGRYSRLAIDTETLRHARTALGMTGDERALRKKVEAHYERFGAERFRVYWFELLAEYETKHGPIWMWSSDNGAGDITKP